MCSFTYAEVTAVAEQRIRNLMELMVEHRDPLFRSYAFGVWLGWRALTLNYDTAGDDARLEALIKEVKIDGH